MSVWTHFGIYVLHSLQLPAVSTEAMVKIRSLCDRTVTDNECAILLVTISVLQLLAKCSGCLSRTTSTILSSISGALWRDKRSYPVAWMLIESTSSGMLHTRNQYEASVVQ